MLENLRFEKITDGTELANARTSSIIQDTQGFIWFGTDLGLVRYDGHELKIFSHDPNDSKSLKDNSIMALCLNKNGNILIGTAMYGFTEFNINKEEFENVNLVSNRIAQVTAYQIDNSGNIWIGTMNLGIFCLDINKNILRRLIKDENEPAGSINSDAIRCLFLDHSTNKLFIGTFTGGLNSYDLETKKYSNFLFDKDNNDSISNNNITFIFRDTRKMLWIGTQNGLNSFDETNGNFIRYLNNVESENSLSGNQTRSICEDDNGLIWISTARNGLTCLDTENQKFTRFFYNKHNKQSLFFNSMGALFKDSSNVIWIGTNRGGIGKYDGEQKKFYNIVNNSSDSKNEDNIVTSVFEDHEKNLWIGTEYRGLFLYSKSPNGINCYSEFDETKGKSISGIIGDKDNNLWISFQKIGLCSMNIYDKILRMPDKNLFYDSSIERDFLMHEICMDKLNTHIIWVGSAHSPAPRMFDTKKKEIIKNELLEKEFKSNYAYAMYFDSNGDLWIGSDSIYIHRYNIKKNTINRYRLNNEDEKIDSYEVVNYINEDNKANIYIGTLNKGFYILDKDRSVIKKYTTKDGLPSNDICCIMLDRDQNLWISTMKGLSKFDTKNYTFRNFSDSDGLIGNGFISKSGFQSDDGTMFFGGNNGITYFNPSEITSNPHIPNIVLTDFQIFYESIKPSPDNPFLKKSISYTKEIILSYKESVITFEFAALIFNNPKMNQYAYKMEGFDEDWVYCGTRRTATYTNLDPGEYTFRVKGSNNDGLWNEEGTSIKIIITPPWYKTILFKGLVGLSVIGSIGSFYQKRIQKLNKEKSQQEEFTKKLIESQENERKRVAAELHDSLGQDLLIIKNKLLVSIKKNEPDKLIEQMNEISDLTSATLNDVREISYNLRPYELDRLGLTKTIESMIERANSSTNINFTGNIDDIDRIFIPEVEINIYRIIQESLNNVIKHSEAREVIVSILKKEKEIVINISDDGKGFDVRKYNMNSKRKGFGLKGIEERVRLLDGEFNIESAEGKGTVLEIFLKVKS